MDRHTLRRRQQRLQGERKRVEQTTSFAYYCKFQLIGWSQRNYTLGLFIPGRSAEFVIVNFGASRYPGTSSMLNNEEHIGRGGVELKSGTDCASSGLPNVKKSPKVKVLIEFYDIPRKHLSSVRLWRKNGENDS